MAEGSSNASADEMSEVDPLSSSLDASGGFQTDLFAPLVTGRLRSHFLLRMHLNLVHV